MGRPETFLGGPEVLHLISGNWIYKLSVADKNLTIEEIPEHTLRVPRSAIPNEIQAKQILLNHLRERNYDISRFELSSTKTQ